MRGSATTEAAGDPCRDIEVTEQLGPETVAYFRIDGVEAGGDRRAAGRARRRARRAARPAHERDGGRADRARRRPRRRAALRSRPARACSGRLNDPVAGRRAAAPRCSVRGSSLRGGSGAARRRRSTRHTRSFAGGDAPGARLCSFTVRQPTVVPGTAGRGRRPQPAGRGQRPRARRAPRGERQTADPISVVGQAGTGVSGLTIVLEPSTGRPLATQPCGAGPYRATASGSPKRVSTVLVGEGIAHATTFDLAPASPLSAAALVARAGRVWRSLHALVSRERLASNAHNAITTLWRYAAPSGFSYDIAGGASGVVIGTRRWDRTTPRARWVRGEQNPALPSRPHPGRRRATRTPSALPRGRGT